MCSSDLEILFYYLSIRYLDDLSSMMHAALRKILSQSSLVLLFLFSCVDRIDFGVEMQRDFPLAIDGMITDEPGPYSVKVSTAFDIDSKINLKADGAVQEMLIIDDLGNTETLALARPGEYRTVTAGFRGVIDRKSTRLNSSH